VSTACSADDDLYADGCDHQHASSREEAPPGYRPFGNNFYYDPHGSTKSVGGILVTTFAGVGTLVFGAALVGQIVNHDGSPTDHLLTDRDAHAFVRRYNRALLRKTIRDVEHTRGGDSGVLELEPSIGVGSIGISGRF
jgi:ABC-type cobalt transport system substrate-binding protein